MELYQLRLERAIARLFHSRRLHRLQPPHSGNRRGKRSRSVVNFRRCYQNFRKSEGRNLITALALKS